MATDASTLESRLDWESLYGEPDMHKQFEFNWLMVRALRLDDRGERSLRFNEVAITVAEALGFDSERLRAASYHLLDRLIVGLEGLFRTRTNWVDDLAKVTPTVTAAVAGLRYIEVAAVLHQLNRTRMRRAEIRSVDEAEQAVRDHLVFVLQAPVHDLWNRWQNQGRRRRRPPRFTKSGGGRV